MYSQDELLCFNVIEAVNKILEFTNDFKNFKEWKKDYLYYDATMMNFIVIGEMAGKISEQFKENNPDVEWHKIYGFRNILAYDYFGIDESIVWDIIKNHIPELKIQIEKILE